MGFNSGLKGLKLTLISCLVGLLGPENEGIIVLRNFGIYFPSDTTSHAKILEYPAAPLSDSQLLLIWIILVRLYVLKTYLPYRLRSSS